MKKVFMLFIAAGTLSLAACGGKSAEDVQKEYCDCVKSAGTDATKLTECATKAAEDAKDIKEWKLDENGCK